MLRAKPESGTEMNPHGLAWRVGVPFLLLVLVETATLVVYMAAAGAAEDRERFAEQAGKFAAFVGPASPSPSAGFAAQIATATGYDVYFRSRGDVLGADVPAAVETALAAIPADGRVRTSPVGEVVAFPVFKGDGAVRTADLYFVRAPRSEWLPPRALEVLLAFWLLAGLIAWLVVRAIVRPLRRLTAALPRLENPTPASVPGTERNDEIGDLARRFVEVRAALAAEQRLRSANEKLAVLGRMTTGLAHEIRNPVAAIQLHAELLARDGADQDSTAMIRDEASRIGELVDQWLFLGRPEPPASDLHDLGRGLREVLDRHRLRFAHAGVRASLEATPGLVVRCDARRLHQVFHNIVLNAIQAMPRGGGLRVGATATADHAEVRFDDDGAGFSAPALTRFGELFYSEKEGGMGVGLAVAADIVRAHGGEIVAQNRTAGGARVVVRLPLAVVGHPTASESGKAALVASD